jgi:(E)-4-hydroxy-3-methylbut-2-enyl-diphosphate synthase
VDELFAEIDRSLAAGQTFVDEHKAAEGAQWLQRIEDENAGELTPERLAAMEKAQAAAEADVAENGNGNGAGGGQVLELPVAAPERTRLDESASPTAGRRFKRG